MDLKSGHLLWTALSPEVRRFAPLDRDIQCEVAVVGAGITGAMVACALVESGVDVVVVDRRQPAEGSTAACSALVLYEIDVPLTKLAKCLGEDHANRAYRAARRALDELEEMIQRHEISCSLRRGSDLYLACEPEDLRWFRDEVAARRAIGIEAELIEAEALRERFHLHRPGAIHSAAALEVDPYRLTLGLIDAAIKKGARVFGQTNIDLRSGEKEHELIADTGPRIRCRHVVIATGYETPEQFDRVRKLARLRSTYCLASQPLREAQPWPESVMFWEAADPYLYARLANHRVILGGEDESIVDAKQRDALLNQKIDTLIEKLASLCPGVAIEPEFAWAGTFATTEDGLPYIGATPEHPRCHFALGYGGNGITYSVLASQILRDTILGRANAEAQLFDFNR
jgi:glycine/D-amino acid oxidase-like deaminating enzyme